MSIHEVSEDEQGNAEVSKRLVRAYHRLSYEARLKVCRKQPCIAGKLEQRDVSDTSEQGQSKPSRVEYVQEKLF